MSMKLAIGLSFGLVGMAGFLVQAARAYFAGDLDNGKKWNSRFDSPYSNSVFSDTDDQLQQFRQDDLMLQQFYGTPDP